VTARGPGQAEAFGADLYQALRAGPGNTVFSPASVAAALAMALIGARGATAVQIAAALRLEGPQDAADSLRMLSAAIADSAEGAAGTEGLEVILRAPNAMWVQSGLPLVASFTSALAGLGVRLHDADFSHAAGQAAEQINALIAEQTGGKITDLLQPGTLDETTRMVLANAVYLKAAWAVPFAPGATSAAPFHPQPGAEVSAAMMRLQARLGYVAGEGYQVAQLLYAGGRLAMAIILPDGPLDSVEDALVARGLSGLLTGLAQARVHLSLPRFTATTRANLRPALESLGIDLAFRPDQADFSGITTADRLSLSAAVHQAHIDVDEQGTEAAAATAVVMRASAALAGDPPVTMVVDRPFLFAITDTQTGLPLFLGRITDPGPA
jgi:serpin B